MKQTNCNDNRFKVIAAAKKALLADTNIKDSAEEMNVIDDFLFRCWQMGWLKQYEDSTPYGLLYSDEMPVQGYLRYGRWECKVPNKDLELVKNMGDEERLEYLRENGRMNVYDYEIEFSEYPEEVTFTKIDDK